MFKQYNKILERKKIVINLNKSKNTHTYIFKYVYTSLAKLEHKMY